MDILLAQSSNSSNIAAFLPLILMFLIFYFIVIRPQSKQRNALDAMIKNLKKGDKVITRGGLYGKIDSFQGKDDCIVKLEINSNVIINIDRNHISSLINTK